ncbi:Transposon Ty3-I Gag-Pol polyprotein [Cucumis melo var. makuwa]|uniref:Transposon Ty3-I Gag-Pol polyprotein n=1 Tax=Cucumis melo var. makuwa TaxID=1194695 RepID=A0A5A7V7D8_CUCMM|nr:Transposon Ty3-I Gag-Pol polyprotein [Cucumis melo var. makuwa]TYK27530.1 Transposon Ty3-I Gag-Pol polyprotein [Cucumis melo var. makuwa]
MLQEMDELKKLIGPHENAQPTIQHINVKFEWKSIPEEVLEYGQNKAKQWEVLTKWEGLPLHEATWESYEEMHRLYPTLHLEDKKKWDRTKGFLFSPQICAIGGKEHISCHYFEGAYRGTRIKIALNLKRHRQAISWVLEDLKGIDPSFCVQRIHLEEGAKNKVQLQRCPNPTLKEVVKK